MQVIFKKYSPARSFLPVPVFLGIFHKYFQASRKRLRPPATFFDKIPTIFTNFSNGRAGTQRRRNPARRFRPFRDMPAQNSVSRLQPGWAHTGISVDKPEFSTFSTDFSTGTFSVHFRDAHARGIDITPPLFPPAVPHFFFRRKKSPHRIFCVKFWS